jgi:major type 1 subunit fimbrin (pilin)
MIACKLWLRRLGVCLLALAGMAGLNAHATTVCSYGGDQTIVNMPAIKVAADAPIGSVVWKQTGLTFSRLCSFQGLWGQEDAFLFRQALDLPGTGLTFFLTYKGNQGSTAAGFDTGVYVDQWEAGGAGGNTVSGTVDIELRKTGATAASGQVSTSSLLAFRIAGQSNQNTNPGNYNIGSLNNIAFTDYTCTVDAGSRSIAVPLGDVREDKFTGKGSTSPDKKFSIGVTCSKPAGTYNVALTFSATADSSKAPGVIALTSDASAAGGVGIQLLANGQPVTFGSALNVGNATSGTAYAIPMTARYYQTTATAVKPGKANGIATFVLTYK